MTKRFGILLSFAFTLAYPPLATEAADNRQQILAPPTLKELAKPATFFSPQLSADGRYLAAILRRPTSSAVVVINLEKENSEPVVNDFGDVRLSWVKWASADRLLVASQIPTYEHSERARTLAQATADPDRTRWISRLVTLSLRDSSIAIMFGKEPALQRHTALSGVTDTLPNDPDHILMPAYVGPSMGLFKVNVISGGVKRVAKGDLSTVGWFTDRNGKPVLKYTSRRTQRDSTLWAREPSEKSKIKWRKIRTIRQRGPLDPGSGAIFRALAPGPESSTYYVLGRLEGSDYTELYLYDYLADKIVETVASRPGYDLAGARFRPDTGEVFSTWYFDKTKIIRMSDEAAQRHLDGLAGYFGDQTIVEPYEIVRDGTIWMLFVHGPQDPGSYHVYDTRTKQARPIADRYGHLANRRYATVRAINFQTRDGKQLTGYLTLPNNSSKESPPPLIMLPHGGPVAQDTFSFDFWSQALAAKGYQVFQPNFRGSAGLGETFSELSFGEWGRAMQDDVDDALAHLDAQGLIDSRRACIVGASYGGFVALTAATRNPGRYVCHVSINGVSDLVTQVEYDRERFGHSSQTYQYIVKQMGEPRKERDAMEKHSPARNVNGIQGSVLLVHGALDATVPLSQSEYMQKQMREARKPVELVTVKTAGHSLGGERHELILYNTLNKFLNKHLPVDG